MWKKGECCGELVGGNRLGHLGESGRIEQFAASPSQAGEYEPVCSLHALSNKYRNVQ